MSKYTTELRYLVKMGFDFGLTSYPIFDENYRAILNQKIIDHYYYKEIGFETPARFRHYLKTKLNEIMPYYNKLYASELISINPLYNTDYTETSNRNITGDSTSKNSANTTSTSTSTSASDTNDIIFSVSDSTPAGLINATDLKGNLYASNANRADNTSANKNNANTQSVLSDDSESGIKSNNLEDYIRTVKGNTGGKTQAEMLKDYRSIFLNIDLEIIKELNELFMGVY